jgi:hypothetical protein
MSFWSSSSTSSQQQDDEDPNASTLRSMQELHLLDALGRHPRVPVADLPGLLA